MLTETELTEAANKIVAAISFGPSSFDEIDAEEAAAEAMNHSLKDSSWVVTAEEFEDNEFGWKLFIDHGEVKEFRREVRVQARRSFITHDSVAQIRLSDGRFLTFVERGW